MHFLWKIFLKCIIHKFHWLSFIFFWFLVLNSNILKIQHSTLNSMHHYDKINQVYPYTYLACFFWICLHFHQEGNLFPHLIEALWISFLEGWKVGVCIDYTHQEILLSTTQVSNDVQLAVRTLTINANAWFTAPICWKLFCIKAGIIVLKNHLLFYLNKHICSWSLYSHSVLVVYPY